MAGDSTLYFTVRRGATALPNRTVHDKALSIQTVGLLAVILALPPSAPAGYRNLVGRGMGEKAVRASLRELEAAGYRYRWLARRRTGTGTERTVTITTVFDTPTAADEALEVAQHMVDDTIVACASDRSFVVQNLCAATGAAHEPEARVPRSGAAHGGAAHASAARLLRKPKDSSLRSESLPSNPPREAAGEGRRESSAPKPEVSSTRPLAGRVSDEDRRLVRECLPQSMRDLPDSGIRRIVPELRLRVERGWTPDELRRVLAAQALPPTVLSMPHLVLHRLDDIDPDGSVAARATRRQQQHAQDSREDTLDVEDSLAALRHRNPQLAELLARHVSHGEARP